MTDALTLSLSKGGKPYADSIRTDYALATGRRDRHDGRDRGGSRLLPRASLSLYGARIKRRHSERWLDQFAKPNDRTYNLSEFCDLIESAGLEPVEMILLGRFRPEHLPSAWRPGFERLPKRSQYRVMELLNRAPTSPTAITRKKRYCRQAYETVYLLSCPDLIHGCPV